MDMIYDSDQFAVVELEVPTPFVRSTEGEVAMLRGGFEIVDKFAKREIYIEGVMAEMFKQNVEALIEQQPTEDEVDDFLTQFTGLMQQPVVLH